MTIKLATRIALAVCFTLSATFTGSVAGALIGAQLIPASDPIDAIANSLAGMTIGCGVTVAVATYVASRLEIRGLRRFAAVSVTVSTIILLLLFAWERKRDSRLFDTRPPAVPVDSTEEPQRPQDTIDRSIMHISLRAFGTLLMLALAAPVVAQDRADGPDGPDGRWSGAIQIQGIELAMNVHFSSADVTASIDIPPQGAFGLPLQNVKMSGDAVSFELAAGPGLAVFNGTTVSPDRIAGSFSQGGAVGTFYLTPNPEAETDADNAHADEDEISVDVDGGELYGAIAIPPTAGPADLVILHAGSGPTTRDGNSQGSGAKNNSLLMLSDALVKHGLAVLRYDKRGIGASAGAAIPEVDLRFGHFVRDLETWITHLRADGRFRRILLAGHSEGALVATLAAGRTPVDGLVLIAGTGRPAGTVLREQLQRNLPSELYAQSDQIIASLEAGELVDSTPPDLAALFRGSVQPYLVSLVPTIIGHHWCAAS